MQAFAYHRRTARTAATVIVIGVVALLAAACSSSATGSTTTTTSGGASATTSGDPTTLRLGYQTNLTHAAALVGLKQGIFAKNLPSNVTLQTSTYNAGPEEVTALLAGSLDAAYMGPNSAITAYTEGNKAIRIISGATSGGAALVVAHGITSASQLKGKTIAPHSSGTPRTSLCAPGCPSRGSPTPVRTVGAVRSPSCLRPTPPPWRPSRPAPSPAPGCPSRGRRAWWTKAMVMSWSTRELSGRRVCSRPLCWL